jgi:hypothetical protein
MLVLFYRKRKRRKKKDKEKGRKKGNDSLQPCAKENTNRTAEL